NLSLIPLIGAIAGGNCVLLKPSEYSTHTSALLVRLISESLPPNLAQVVLGDSKVGESLLGEKFDLIFFTGSVSVGKIVMQKAAAHLTPVVLELGGKNPCIITKSADIMSAAKKVVWGKFLNAGQTCIAPDYLLVQECVLEEFVEALKKWVKEFFGENPKQSANFGRIISARHFARIESLIYQSLEYADSLPVSDTNFSKANCTKIALGGELDAKSLYVAPTIFILPRDTKHPLMQEEIFAPIMPIIPFGELSECLAFSTQLPKPLASYIFTRDSQERDFFLQNFSFGNGCVNDCVMQVANPYLPFGGIGNSGMGSYHGAQSFLTFTHQKSVVENHFEIPLRYPPFRDKLFGIDFKKLCKFATRL
ncbi:aldehyde dehydrogenase family protein, partial [uncultured Helicobacter sp.]|uniref:aldehyde dehydrogenase family protein n=1 Tax=uncultured Helicobacter sp. TaxID=175537 RepID=UPI00374E7C75